MRLGRERGDAFARGLVHHVGLVERDDDGDVPHAFDVGEHLVDRVDLRERIGMRAVYDMEDQIGLADLLQRGFERLDELGGQPAHEADRIHIGVETAVLGPRPAHGRVQGGEQRVLHEFRGSGQSVRQ